MLLLPWDSQLAHGYGVVWINIGSQKANVFTDLSRLLPVDCVLIALPQSYAMLRRYPRDMGGLLAIQKRSKASTVFNFVKILGVQKGTWEPCHTMPQAVRKPISLSWRNCTSLHIISQRTTESSQIFARKDFARWT